MSLRRWLFLIGFALVAVPGTAQTNCIDDISTRLEARLKALPDRWDEIPPPLVPVSGRPSEEVLATASEEEQALVSEWITLLALSPPEERAALIGRELQARPLSEVDVWLPEKFTDDLRATSLEEPTLYVEAWLEWAEALGRKDALLMAAGSGLDRLSRRGESRSLLETASRWASLPSSDHATRGRADVLSKYAARLFATGENDKALETYRSARKLFEEIGDQRGQGYTFHGEAVLLSRLGEKEEALNTYRRARKLFEEVGDRRGEGYTFFGEAEVLYSLGQIEKALESFRSARKLFEEVGDRRGQVFTFNGEAVILARLGDNEAALAAYKHARKLSEDMGDRRGQANTFRGEAGVLYKLGEIEKALAAYKYARKLYEEVGSLMGQGYTFLGEGDVLRVLYDNKKALEVYRSARKIFEQTGSRLNQGNALLGEAAALSQLGDNKKALEVYRSASKIFEQVGSWESQGRALVGEANVLSMLGENEKALGAYKTAHKLYEQIGDRWGQGYAFSGEADVLAIFGENEKALDAYRTARKLYEQIGFLQGQVHTFLGEAAVLTRFGENDKALEAYRSANKIFEQVRSPLDQGNTLLGEAALLFQLGENEKALDTYRSAHKIYEQSGHLLGEGSTLLGEADVLSRLGDNEKALDAYRSAHKLFEEIEDPLGLGNTLLGEARIQSRQGNEKDAKNLATQAAAAFRKGGSVNSERDAWLVMAEVEHSSGNLELAVSAAREAVRLHAVWRSKRISEAQRAREDERISAAYDTLVPVLLSQARTEQALAAAEEARSHVLLDLLAVGFKFGKQGAAIDLRAERRRLESELAQIETEGRQAADADRLAELQRRRNRIDRELDWNQYQTLAAEQNTFLTAQPLDAAGIRAAARETGPILLYYAADKELIGFLVPADGTDVFTARIDLSRGRLTEAVQRYIHDKANPFYEERTASQSRELWDLLLAPFVARLPAGGPLVIVPHGPLHELPFETLVDPAGTPLFERWTVSFAPSVSTLARARERHREPQPKDGFLVFSSGRGLELTEAEAGEVARLFGNDKAAFRPTEARFENYENLVPDTRHLLISTTGTWSPGDSRKTFLEILPTPGVHDSRLSVAEIAAIPLTAELVALEACDTARGETRQTDERIDLTRAFLIAGAASVLSTRWKVPDEPATRRFLLDFYRAYRQGGPDGKGLRKDQALTEARRRSRERGDPAQVWAAWMLVGDAR
ncbi:MAG TPA: tetratricopeptide repeat protein [Thermoanaerobaculia bacterium]